MRILKALFMAPVILLIGYIIWSFVSAVIAGVLNPVEWLQEHLFLVSFIAAYILIGLKVKKR